MDKTRELLRLTKEGNEAAREQIILNNVGLIWSVVRRFTNRGYESEDLFQIGSIGLLKAIDRFDTAYEVKFSTYAVPLIIGEIRRYLRDDGMLKVSRSLKETAWKVRKAEADWQNTVGREPTLEELSEKTGIRKEEIVQSLAANTEVDSLYRSIPGNQGKEITLGEQICDRHNEIEERTDHLFLEQLLDTLIDEVLGCHIPMSAKNQKETFQTIVEETLGENCDFETVKSIHENLSELVEETKDEPAPPVLNKTQLKQLLENNGAAPEKLQEFESRYADVEDGPETSFAVSNVVNTKSFEIKTPDVTIKVAPDKTYLVENRMIDGRPCLVIAINEHVEINGISVRPVPLADRKTAGEGAEDTAPWQEENGTQDPSGSDEIRPVATGIRSADEV